MKRGLSGLSLVVAVNKPSKMSSHDVVNFCRRIFGERRVGHTGTLDPMATGILPICIGPATRLEAYMVGHDKRYRVRIAFGAGTDTDDAEGEVISTGVAPACVFDDKFATSFVQGLVGAHKQLPPAYSAIKVGGKKAYEAARQGTVLELAPRDIEVYDARLLAINESNAEELPSWDVEFHVSKGTYIRSLARDAGIALSCPAHVAALERTALGSLRLEECVSLETLEEVKQCAALDPIALLGVRFAFIEGDRAAAVGNGNALGADEVELYELRKSSFEDEFCSCTARSKKSGSEPRNDEVIAIILDNRVVALYEYEKRRAIFKARCVFQTGVSRGRDI